MRLETVCSTELIAELGLYLFLQIEEAVCVILPEACNIYFFITVNSAVSLKMLMKWLLLELFP